MPPTTTVLGHDPIKSPCNYRINEHGWEVQQRCLVKVEGAAHIPEALMAATTASGFAIGNIFGNGYVEEVEAAPYTDGGDNSTYIVTQVIRARPTDYSDVQGGASLQQDETTKEWLNNSYQDIVLYHEGEPYDKVVPKMICSYVKSWTKTEGNGTLTYGADLEDRAKSWVGKVDTATRKWMCTGLHFRRKQNSLYLWEVTYTYEYREDTWDVDVWPTDESGRKVQGSEVMTIQIYKTTTFTGAVP